MKTSRVGIDLIKKFEGCRLEAYQDVIGVWTIGYGMTGPGVYQGQRISQQQAEEGLLHRLAAEFEPGVLQAIGDTPTTQGQFDAMASLTWNIGVGAFAQSSVARHHVDEDYTAAAASFLLWNKAGGRVLEPLARRRAVEAGVYRQASPGATTAPVPDFGVYKAAKAMQQALQGIGLYKGPIDGKWGPTSRAAYDEFDGRV